MDLVIDRGNSRQKLALFQDGRCIDHTVVGLNPDGWLPWLNGRVPVRIAIGASGEALPVSDLQRLAPVTVLRGDSPAPIRTAYATPATLGVDRWANAVAIAGMFPGRAALAVDLGTCITFDLVDPSGCHLGGAISPGLRMRAAAMHAHTARLPEVDPDGDVQAFGTSTESALRAGVVTGIRYELEGWAREGRYQWPDLAVVLTGGDAPRVARALKSGIFADPLLTLRGLHALLESQSPPARTAGFGPGAGTSDRPGRG